MQANALRTRLAALSTQSHTLVDELSQTKAELQRLQYRHSQQITVLQSDLEMAKQNALRSEAELSKLRPAVRVRGGRTHWPYVTVSVCAFACGQVAKLVAGRAPSRAGSPQLSPHTFTSASIAPVDGDATVHWGELSALARRFGEQEHELRSARGAPPPAAHCRRCTCRCYPR